MTTTVDPGSTTRLADGYEGDEHAAEIRAALARLYGRDLTDGQRVALARLRERTAGR